MNRALIISAGAHVAVLLLLWQLGVAFSRPVMRGYPRLITATLVTKTIMAPAAASAGPPAAAEPKTVSPPAAPKFTPVEKKKEAAKVTSKPEPKKTPPASKQPATKSEAASSSSGSSGSRGASATPAKTGGGGNSIKIEAAAFPYAYYSEAIQNRIESNWQAPEGPERLIAVVYFKIARNGEIKDIKLEQASGSFEFDRAAISAVTYASPLPPLPVDYREPTLVIRYEFAANNY